MPSLDLDAIRTRLQNSHGREYWRSLEELSGAEEFQDFVKHEFPRAADFWEEPISRRSFLKLMGASFAMAFFSGCRKPLEYILPYNKAPEDIVPGKPLYYASALTFQGYARGILVETQMGRPTKIEGNPQHPDSLGATDIFAQAATLAFYDPDRSQTVVNDGIISTWPAFFETLNAVASAQKAKGGAGLRILTETVTSASLGGQLSELQRIFPKAKWHQYEPMARDNVRAGSVLAFGHPMETRYRFDRADVVLSLDADFLLSMPGGVRYAKEYSERRRTEPANARMNRLYVVETNPSITGSMADHRLAMSSAEIDAFARALATDVGVSVVAPSDRTLDPDTLAWIGAAARDLRAHHGSSLVIAGDAQPPIVHWLAHAMNEALGNFGKSVEVTEAVAVIPVDHAESLRQLVDDMRAGQVDFLLILGGNPAFTAPVDLRFSEALLKVPLRVHLGLHEDETSELCQWHLAEAHPLESWGDARAFDGTVSIVQPQIEPLYGGKSDREILSALIDASPRSGHDIVHDFWKKKSGMADFESVWKKSLNDGVMPDTRFAPKSVSVRPGVARERAATVSANGLEILFRPDPTIWDGRFANNGWLQELPKPITKLTWENAALIAPSLAGQMGLSNGDVVRIRSQGRSIEAPMFIVPGHAGRSVTVTLGYGRSRAGRVGTGVGFNAYALRTSQSPWSSADGAIEKTGRSASLANTQHHYSMEGRDFVRAATLSEFESNPTFAKEKAVAPAAKDTLYNYSRPTASDQYAWGMAIDLNTCIGCSACTIACQAENNIPIVGKEQVRRGREMHWIRVDRYYTGDLDNPQSYAQPVPCMHCEDAPCEVVCPVGATTHSEEGLNQMVYNRCIGTRYCSNSCPYKVRRFNFLNYTEAIKGPLKMMENPDVTVRSRGVMEKCTYCVQRIQEAKIGAEKENRTVRDGEIVPACAQVCPGKAIVFGNVKDPTSAVSKIKAGSRDYGILTELGTRPRTTYEARLRNPNPEIKEARS